MFGNRWRGSSSLRSIQSIKERPDQTVAVVKQRCLPLMTFAATINFSNGSKRHISGQSLPDLVWWHDESFKGRHDSFCTMNTGAASVFLQSLAAHFWSPPNGSFGAV